jgi:hypothetical protein
VAVGARATSDDGPMGWTQADRHIAASPAVLNRKKSRRSTVHSFVPDESLAQHAMALGYRVDGKVSGTDVR